jgi:hypothetical protein
MLDCFGLGSLKVHPVKSGAFQKDRIGTVSPLVMYPSFASPEAFFYISKSPIVSASKSYFQTE